MSETGRSQLPAEDTEQILFEPFAGGAALFFHLEPDAAVLSDLNEDLINCYRVFKHSPNELISTMAGMENSAEYYYQVRESQPSEPIGRAARTIYLSRLSFNGLYRVNLAGMFNVPYGGKSHVCPLDEDAIQTASHLLRHTELLSGDFAKAVESATEGDVVYLDPPYTVAHSDNGFVKYNARIFSWDDQQRPAIVANELDERGVAVLVSNADHLSVESLYSNFEKIVIQRTSQIAANSNFRRPITECVFFNRRTI